MNQFKWMLRSCKWSGRIQAQLQINRDNKKWKVFKLPWKEKRNNTLIIVNYPPPWLVCLLLHLGFKNSPDRKTPGCNSDMTVYHFPVKPVHILLTCLCWGCKNQHVRPARCTFLIYCIQWIVLLSANWHSNNWLWCIRTLCFLLSNQHT